MCWWAILFAWCLLLPPTSAVASIPNRIDAFIRAELAQPYNYVPGLVSAVVQANASDFVRGYGVQKLGGTTAVGPHTIFGLGSTSKTVLAIGFGRLFDEGRLSWEDPIISHMPSFQWSNEYAQSKMTIADLLAHRSGLRGGQGGFSEYTMSEKETAQRLHLLTPLHSFRDVFDYSNEAYVLAGQVLGAIAGMTWCEYLATSIFPLLGMNSTFCSREDIPEDVAAERLASVHYFDPCHSNGSSTPLTAWTFASNGVPSIDGYGKLAGGSMLSTGHDVAKLMQLLLGKHPSKLLKPSTSRLLMAGHVVVPVDWVQGNGLPAEISAGDAATAGFGFDLTGRLFHGERLCDKSGDTGMHKARLAILPDHGIGIFLLGNLGGAVGGPLTALKFGVAALLEGYDPNEEVQSVLTLTGYLDHTLPMQMTCNQCGRSGGSATLYFPDWCAPSNMTAPPLVTYCGQYIDTLGGESVVQYNDEAVAELTLSLGPLSNVPLQFGPDQFFVNSSCAELSAMLVNRLGVPKWSPILNGLPVATGWCTATQFLVEPNIPGVSAKQRITSMPWGMSRIFQPLVFVFISHGPNVFRIASMDMNGVFSADKVAFPSLSQNI